MIFNFNSGSLVISPNFSMRNVSSCLIGTRLSVT